ncbi:DNA methyltransferase [Siccirubricoccus sp. G192]|uniref:class I SAM-dependent DNA methyltransferase n=1 Tax=Siccirubricoccus sp. G192 TaxID=2849651 RepID=UPI0020C2EA26
MDWSEIDPSVLGTLFERGLDPDKRSQLGAHYTDRDKIMQIVEPVVVRPLLADWAAARARLEAALARAAAAKTPATRQQGADAARAEYTGFLERLRRFRVLDPACGSGNFLYLALLALKDIEHRAGLEAEALGLQREFPAVGPEQLLGIEINPYAAELARVSVWIGHIQWARRNGYEAPRDPVLRALDTIECRDAVLSGSGTAAEWPAADAIIGNPPFLGDKAMIGTLGEDYTRRLRAAYAGRVPGGADLVCYWFEKAREAIAEGRTLRTGLVATNSIRGGANRRVLDRICESGVILEAWSDEAWTLDGAAVRVSLVCFSSNVTVPCRLDGEKVTAIHADLTAEAANLTTAVALAENKKIAFNGIQKTGPFEVDGDTARRWLSEPSNPNGQSNTAVLRPWWNGIDVTRRSRDSWCIDFGPDMTEEDAAFYLSPYAHAANVVKLVRAANSLEPLRRFWWRHWRPRRDMQVALLRLPRAIVTPEVSKHRVFAWLPLRIGPDKNLVVIARDDDTTFGILHSRFHEAWALRLGTSLEDRPRYTPTTTFETFPFPDGLTPNLPAATYAADPRAQSIAAAARALVEARDRWLNPPDLVQRVPEVVPGFPDRLLPRDAKAAAILKTRTLTALYNSRGKPEGAWLDGLHATLDAAVAAAYGWPADIPEAEALARLLALNTARVPA